MLWEKEGRGGEGRGAEGRGAEGRGARKQDSERVRRSHPLTLNPVEPLVRFSRGSTLLRELRPQPVHIVLPESKRLQHVRHTNSTACDKPAACLPLGAHIAVDAPTHLALHQRRRPARLVRLEPRNLLIPAPRQHPVPGVA